MDGSTYLWAFMFVLLISAVVVACVMGLKMIKNKQDIKKKDKQKQKIKQMKQNKQRL